MLAGKKGIEKPAVVSAVHGSYARLAAEVGRANRLAGTLCRSAKRLATVYGGIAIASLEEDFAKTTTGVRRKAWVEALVFTQAWKRAGIYREDGLVTTSVDGTTTPICLFGPICLLPAARLLGY